MAVAPETEEFLLPAKDALIRLATEMRPAWREDHLSAALAGAFNAGWTWTRTFATVSRLLLIEDSDPYDLAEEVRRDLWNKPGQPVHEPPPEYLAARTALNRRAEDHDAHR